MPHAARVLFASFWLVSLSACAPVMLGRTPTPAAVGETEVHIAAGYPLLLTPLTVCSGSDPYSDPDCPFEGYVGLDYWPRAAPIHIMSAWGVAPDTEANTTFGLSLAPGFRLGGKTLVSATLPKLAVDYGASLSVSGSGLDAGLLASVPYEGGEIYSALRGFGNVYWLGSPAGLLGALTLGSIATANGYKVFFEVTLSTGRYNEFGPTAGVSPLGFFVTPAFGFYF